MYRNNICVNRLWLWLYDRSHWRCSDFQSYYWRCILKSSSSLAGYVGKIGVPPWTSLLSSLLYLVCSCLRCISGGFCWSQRGIHARSPLYAFLRLRIDLTFRDIATETSEGQDIRLRIDFVYKPPWGPWYSPLPFNWRQHAVLWWLIDTIWNLPAVFFASPYDSANINRPHSPRHPLLLRHLYASAYTAYVVHVFGAWRSRLYALYDRPYFGHL